MAPANIRKEGSAIDLTIAVGILAASGLSLKTYTYLDADQRLFTSENFRYSPDVRITITAVDAVLKRFDGTFSGTIYNPNSNTPQLALDQVLINSGQLVRVNY